MYLYSLTLQPGTGIHKAIFGNFSASKAQEIAVSKGKTLEIYRSNENTGVLEVVYSQEVFGIIRSLCTFRMTGANRDMIVIGSDSGRIVFLQLDPATNNLEQVHLETYGKSGCRRIVPGQYVASDPKGRAVMIAAIEKQKFVYILNRDSTSKLTISSPLEAHKGRTIVFDICGIDVGFENPQFACLEADYGDPELPDSAVVTGQGQKLLTFYEMDLGLNHVIRKIAMPTDNSANILIPVPGGSDGPGGVLLCCENIIRYFNFPNIELSCTYPRRADMSTERGLMINCYATHKQKDLFFFLIHTELGDLYKVSLKYNKDQVESLSVQYFDTIFPCVSICILKTGFLFAAAEYGNHALYQFQNIGENDEFAISTSDSMETTLFMPRKLTNIAFLYDTESLAAITDMKIQDLAEEGNPQIYALCGRGPRSALRVLRHGLGVTEMAYSNLPGKPNGVWSLKSGYKEGETSYDKYIVISFLNATLVLGIGEKVTEVTDSGFDVSGGTIHAGLLANNCYLQILQYGMRVIASKYQVDPWEAPGKISRATSNEKQVAFTLQGGILVYFELDSSGKLKEAGKREMEQEVICISISNIPEGRTRARFLALGCFDNTIKILSLDPEGCLSRLSTQALPGSQPESVCLLEMGHSEETKDLYLHVGLSNGVMLRTVIDSITGQLSDTRARFLGNKPARLFKGFVAGSQALVSLSSRPWIAYNYMSRFYITPLSYETLEYAASFSSEMCPEGFVGISGNTLRIFTIEKLGELFNQSIVPLRYTPRKMEIYPINKNLIIIESDHNAFPVAEREQLKEAVHIADIQELTDAKISTPSAGIGRWAACVRILDPRSLETTEIFELTNNETAISLCVTNFTGYESEMFLVLGTVKDMNLHPRAFTEAYINVFRIVNDKLELFHKTIVEDIPLAICPFYGKILIGVGKFLRLYELGKKKILKKCENKTTFPNLISNIKVDGERIFVTDISESVSVLTWSKEDNQIYCFADDVISRFLTNFIVLDHDTIAAVDKFENMMVLRLPDACEEDERDINTVKFKWEAGFLNSAYYKLEHIAHFYIGDLATSLQKSALSEGGAEALVYGTTMGAIGTFLPITHKDDVEFFVHLEMYMRQEARSLVGRDHMSFRSFYAPLKNVIDGDLCEQYSKLDYQTQRRLAEQLEHSPNEILKRLEDFRNKIF